MAERDDGEFFIFQGHIHKIPKQNNIEEIINFDEEFKGEKTE